MCKVTASFKYKQLLPFGYAWQSVARDCVDHAIGQWLSCDLSMTLTALEKQWLGDDESNAAKYHGIGSL